MDQSYFRFLFRLARKSKQSGLSKSEKSLAKRNSTETCMHKTRGSKQYGAKQKFGFICLDTNITKNRLNVSGNSPFFPKYLKIIWLYFINITVKTQKNSRSFEIATQISAILLNISHMAYIINGEY